MRLQYWGDSLGNGVPPAMTDDLRITVDDGHVGGDSAAQVLARFKSGKGSGGQMIGPGTGNLVVIRCAHPEVMAGNLDAAKASITEMVKLAGDALVCELGQRSTVALGTSAQDVKRRKDRATFNAWLSATFGDRYVPLQSLLVAKARAELQGQLTARDLEGMLQGMLPDVLAADSAQDGHMEPLAAKWAGQILAEQARLRGWPSRVVTPYPENPSYPPVPPPQPPPAPALTWWQRLLDRLRGLG